MLTLTDPEFTFHYVSIKSLKRSRKTALIIYLHSTMFLLNLFAVIASYFKFIPFTFHYVSIKSKYSICMSYSSRVYLHSTMFLLNPSLRLYPIHSHPNLHSTMFLLNQMTQSASLDTQKHLHSTMFLLNRCLLAKVCGVYVIYIPLCFY